MPQFGPRGFGLHRTPAGGCCSFTLRGIKMLIAMLALSRSDVESLLDLDELVDAVASAMVELSAGRASVPPRVAAFVERSGGLLGAMPAYLPGAEVLETKLVSLFPGNAGTALPTHQAVIIVFDTESGEPLALLDGTSITTLRTAA